jgi:hypothetical protein
MERLAKNNDFYVYQYYQSGLENRYWVNTMLGVEAQIGITKNLIIGGSYLQTTVNNYMWVRIEDEIADWSESSTKSDYMNQQWQVSLKYQINGRR